MAAAAATVQLLVARATGGALEPLDLVADAGLAAALALVPWRLAPLLVYSAGLLVPALYGRGAGLLVWALLAAAALILTRRRTLGPRGVVAALAGCVAIVWMVAAVGEGAPPPTATALRVGGALVAALALGGNAFLLAPLAAWPGGSEAWTATGPVPRGPDVVVVSVDTLRLDAARGMRAFADGTLLEAQAPAPWTLPSLATIHTGLLPASHGAVRVPAGFASTSATTLAERFGAAGWDTAATVETPFAEGRFGLRRGFAIVRPDEARAWVLPREPFGDRARPTGALLLGLLGVTARVDGGVDRRVQDVAELVAARRERPLFLWVHVLDAHLPYRHAADLDLPVATRAWLATAHRLSIGTRPDADTLALLRRAYEHEVEVVDAALLRLRALLPDAVFVLTSDHGEEFGEHGGFEHGHALWQEVLAVPLLVDGVDVVASGPVGLQDIAPTLLGAAGLPADGLDGRDLRVPGDAPLPSVNLLYGPLDARAVRVGARKLVADGEGRRSYDLAVDPAERAPGAGDPALEPLLPRIPGAEGGAVPLDGGVTDALRSLGYVE